MWRGAQRATFRSPRWCCARMRARVHDFAGAAATRVVQCAFFQGACLARSRRTSLSVRLRGLNGRAACLDSRARDHRCYMTTMVSEKLETKVCIIGSGPAAHTAAIYAGRAELAPILLEGWLANGIAAGAARMLRSCSDAVQGDTPRSCHGLRYTQRA